jgi:hypothetical protein
MRHDKRCVTALFGVFVVALLVVSMSGCTSTNRDSNNTSASTTVTPSISSSQQSVITIFASTYNPAVNQSFTIYGALQNGVTGAPIPNQPVVVNVQSPLPLTDTRFNATTDANGNYTVTITEASQGDYPISVAFSNTSSGYLGSGSMLDVTVGNPIPVVLTLTITPANPAVNQKFTMSGKLTDINGNILPNTPLYIDCQIPDGTWWARANITTDSNGNYSWSYSEATQGQYYYEVTYWGNGTYGAATPTQELAIGTLSPVTLTLNTNIANPATGQSFTLSGKLTDANSNPLSGKEIDLYDTAVAGGISATKYTDQNGAYSFVLSENTSGYHLYHVEFIGDQTHADSIVSLTVPIGTTANVRS